MYGEEVQGTQSEKYIKRSEKMNLSRRTGRQLFIYQNHLNRLCSRATHINRNLGNSQIRLAPSVMQQGSSQSEARASKDEKQECPGVSPDASWPL